MKEGGEDRFGSAVVGELNTGPDSLRDRLTNEAIAKEKAGRVMAICFAVFLGVAAAACLIFSLTVGVKFAFNQPEIKKAELEVSALKLKFALASMNKEGGKVIGLEQLKDKDEQLGNLTVKTFAQLIPATFSSALCLILLITMARFITNYVKPDSDDGKDKQDYGAIAVLVQEIGALIKSFKS